MLNTLNRFPARLLDMSARQLHSVLDGPTLIHLKGKRERPLFVSVIQHGNEDTGWEVIRRIMTNYRGKSLPRSLSIFISNVDAARYGKRKLARQPDFNRVWGGGESEEACMMQDILRQMRERRVFASIDIHNNSGFNPHYACVNRLEPSFLHLAKRFARPVVYFIRPEGVQSMAFADLCPAVTLECGQPGDEYGIQLASKYVDAVLNQSVHRQQPVQESEYDLFHTVAVVKVPEQFSVSFDGSLADIAFIAGIERLNFEEIAPGSHIATLRSTADRPLHVYEESGSDIFDRHFAIEGNRLVNKKPVIPSMLTTQESIIRQDCLCYLMERYELG